ncbi:hypothetical protein EJ994_03645 [Maribacter sp. MJ134]|uniref:DUF6095 family protein n=1 Tax=Maribacter sp. MJ134 TaxID=2496865 RepID=UPI000F82FEFC|nr:DUF6095 family protein [Maribacter sp. MJ134]AZQ57938.1 hypothetical protein EJ994_03645 [Maribacter sp. MJ134]
MRRTNKDILVKGVKQLAYTVMLMFLAPIVIWQAFKNEDHPFYWPVLVVGILLAMAAIGMGFRGIKTIMNSLFGKK